MPTNVVGVLQAPTASDAVGIQTRPPRRVWPTLKPSSVEFSRPVFVAWWVALTTVHCSALTYHARITKFYWRLPNSPVGEMFELYDMIIPPSYGRVVAVMNAAIASAHAIALLRMLHNSAGARQLVFFVDTTDLRDGVASTASFVPVSQSRWQRCVACTRHLFAYNGPLGVEGKYFDVLLYVTEFVETFLQTYQASRVDALVARRGLSRLCVVVLAVNCWCVPLIHVVYRHHVAKKRLLSLMCDCLLDLVSSVVVPGALFYVYLAHYEPATRTIERTRLYDDRWLVQLWSEYELVVIASWVDVLSRLVFALGLLLNLDGVKQLLRAETVDNDAPKPTLVRRLSSRFLRPAEATAPTEADWLAATRPLSPGRTRRSFGNVLVRFQRIHWATIFHGFLVLWGVVVVAVHVAAEMKHGSDKTIASCPIQFHKWLGRAPVCLLLDINCHALEINGSTTDIERQWAEIEPSSVLRVVLRHCSALDIPRSILQFHNLKAIKLYNSTLVSWNVEAALTGEILRAFRSLQFVRVKFSDAMLPPGLLTPAFPRDVRIMEFCVTNLATLPADVETAWPSGMRLSLEWSAFTAIPPVALRLSPWQLSMSGNPITDIPTTLFELPHIRRIGLAHTFFPNVSTASSTLRQVSIVGSPVEEPLPLWMDAVVKRAQDMWYLVVALYAGDTPFCSNHKQDTTLIRSVSCQAPHDDVSYPLAFEDQQSGLALAT